MSIKIMIDSASDFTQQAAEQLDLLFMPMNVTFDGKDYLDGVDLFADEFYKKLESCSSMPQTSLINEYRWSEALKQATDDGSQVVVITISSKLSGTYQAAVDAAKAFDGNVFVVDSLNAAHGEGVLVEYAIRLRQEGKTAKEIYELLNEKKKDVRILAVIDTLKYLKKGGRISTATAIVGATLSIKPIVSIIDGEVKMIGKAMGNRKGNALLNEIIEKSGGIDLSMPWGYVWSGNDKTKIEKYMKDSGRLVLNQEKTLHVIGSTIGTHVGSGAVGIAYFRK